MRIIKPSEVVFANDKIGETFHDLDDNDDLKKAIKRAIQDIGINAYCGIQIPKRLFPKEYVVISTEINFRKIFSLIDRKRNTNINFFSYKYKINNLWKYDLPNSWRLIYTLNPLNQVEILSVILEWFSHKDYERRFHY